MKRKVKLILILALMSLALLWVTACDTFGSSGQEVRQQLVEVTRGDLTISVTGSGKIETSLESNLTFGSTGKIEEILVTKGDRVSKGEVLARLDTSALELAYTQAEVALTQTELALTQAQLAEQTAEYNLKDTRDTKDALGLALLNAQINLDIVEDDLDDARKSYGWEGYDKVESELNQAKAYYDQIQDRLREAEPEDADSWLLLLDRAEERLETAQANWDNFVSGYDTDEIALKKKQVSAAAMAVAQAQQDLDELADGIAIQELQVASAQQSVVQAQQSVELARRSLGDAQRQLDEATITAPFDGVVATVLAKEGESVPSPSMAPKTIIYLIDTRHMELVVEVDEIDIPLVKLDQEAVISLDALPNSEFKGVVTAIYPIPREEGGVVLYDIKIALEAPENSGIKIGMSASADIVIDEHGNVLTVPSRAIQQDSEGRPMVKVMSDEQIQERPVVIGLDDGLRVEILSGLREGETVVIESRAKST